MPLKPSRTLCLIATLIAVWAGGSWAGPVAGSAPNAIPGWSTV